MLFHLNNTDLRVSRRLVLGSLCVGPICGLLGSARLDATESSNAASDSWVTTIRSNLLPYRRAENRQAEQLNYMVQVTRLADEEHENNHVCLGRAILFRALQIISHRWHDGVVRLYEIERIEANSGSDAAKELFLDEFEMDESRLVVPRQLAETRMPGVEGVQNWYRFHFAGGEGIQVNISKQLLPDEFFRLQRKLKIDKDTSDELRVQIESLKERIILLLNLPLEPRGLFTLSDFATDAIS